MTQKITIRLPKNLSDDLSLLGKELGMSKFTTIFNADNSQLLY